MHLDGKDLVFLQFLEPLPVTVFGFFGNMRIAHSGLIQGLSTSSKTVVSTYLQTASDVCRIFPDGRLLEGAGLFGLSAL